ncbi:MAG: hypothetical protein ACJ72N_01140 [Labedaea sp.]
MYTFKPSVVEAFGNYPEPFRNDESQRIYDPHLLRNDGTLWPGSVSGDQEYWLELTQEERRQISDAGGILASILSPEGHPDYLASAGVYPGANWLDPEITLET